MENKGFDEFVEFVEDNEAVEAEMEKLLELAYDPYCAAVVELGAKHGYTFNADDVEELVDELIAEKALKSGELSDVQLEAVAGGAKGGMGLGRSIGEQLGKAGEGLEDPDDED